MDVYRVVGAFAGKRCRIALAVPAVAMLGMTMAHLANAAAVEPGPITKATPPQQPASGPGGADYVFSSVKKTYLGAGVNSYWIYEPVSSDGSMPLSAPLVILVHGYQIAGYKSSYAHDLVATHLTRKGNVVVYPMYQTSVITPCIGFFNSEGCMKSATKGIVDGIKSLQSPGHVRPELDKTSYFGHSFGAIITANLVNRWASVGLPQPRAVFLDEPEDGNPFNGTEGALDKDMSGVPASVLYQCYIGQYGSRTDGNEGCNALFPKLSHIPAANRNLVMAYTDDHGTPVMSTAHGLSSSSGNVPYIYNFVLKSFDGMRSCVFEGKDCAYGMGNTPEHTFNGNWSDGVPVTPLKVQTEAPIYP